GEEAFEALERAIAPGQADAVDRQVVDQTRVEVVLGVATVRARHARRRLLRDLQLRAERPDELAHHRLVAQLAGDFGEAREERIDRHRPRRRSAPAFQIARQTDLHADTSDTIVLTLELRHPGAGAVFVLLRRSPSDTARAFQHAITEDRHGALARDHVAAFGRDDALDDRAPGALGQLTTRPREASRSDGFALAAVDAAPDRTVHAIEGDQATAGVTDRDADPDLHIPGLVDRTLNDLIGFREGHRHGKSPPRRSIRRSCRRRSPARSPSRTRLRPTPGTARRKQPPPEFRRAPSAGGAAAAPRTLDSP